MRVLVALVLVLASCTEKRAPEPTRSVTVLPPPTQPDTARELRVGVGAMLSPMATFDSYTALLRGLGQAVGRPHQLVQRRTYQELNQLIIDGEVDIAFICSGAWVALPAEAAEILVVPEVGGRAEYRGLIVTRRDAPYRTFADLENTRFAYTDPISNTGYYYPVSLIVGLGKKPSSFFASTTFSGSHDRSLLAVERGIVDAAAIFDIGFGRMSPKLEGPDSPLRVLERSGPMAPPPVVTPSSVPDELRDALRTHLLNVADQPDGRAQLDALGVDRFRLPAAVDYGPVRRMMEMATGTQ